MPKGIWIDDSQFDNTSFYIPTYNELRITRSTHIHPNSSAAQLGLTPSDLEPILQDQREYLQNEYAQPPANQATSYHHNTRIKTPPNLALETQPQTATEQLGLTPEEAREVHEECIRAQREIQEEMAKEDQVAREWMIERDTRPTPLEDDTHGTVKDDNVHVVLFQHRSESDDGAVYTGHEDDSMHELAIVDDGHVDWATEMEEAIDLSIQGEYTPARYFPTPTPPCPAPWYPPPPTSDYTRRRTHHAPPHVWYNPTRTRRTPRRPSFCPHTHAPPTRRPPFDNRKGHVTATRRDRVRTTTRAADATAGGHEGNHAANNFLSGILVCDSGGGKMPGLAPAIGGGESCSDNIWAKITCFNDEAAAPNTIAIQPPNRKRKREVCYVLVLWACAFQLTLVLAESIVDPFNSSCK
jgi:hypothetical protein